MSCVTAVNREQETGRCSFAVVTLRANDAAKTQGIAAPRLAVRVERKEMFGSLPLTRERKGRSQSVTKVRGGGTCSLSSILLLFPCEILNFM